MSRLLALILVLAGACSVAFAQGNATDVRAIQLYGFGGATGVYTGLDGGRNLGITAGVDLGFGGYRGFLPMFEARGTYPVHSGTIVDERSFEAGLRVERQYRAAHPYVDILFGRGQLQYQGYSGLSPDQTVLYERTNSNIVSFGGGTDYDVAQSFAVKLDAQVQHYDTPVTISGSINSTLLTVGVVYRFGYGQRRIY
jgi:hypothetical protein